MRAKIIAEQRGRGASRVSAALRCALVVLALAAGDLRAQTDAERFFEAVEEGKEIYAEGLIARGVVAADARNEAVKEILAANGSISTLSSSFNGPSGVAVDAAGNVYVADLGDNAVKEIVAATGVAKTLSSGFDQPSGVAVDAAGNVYVADTGNNAVKEILAASGAVITLASGFRTPTGVAVSANGRVLYVIDYENIWKFTP